jgi:serine/threonine-protein kinase
MVFRSNPIEGEGLSMKASVRASRTSIWAHFPRESGPSGSSFMEPSTLTLPSESISRSTPTIGPPPVPLPIPMPDVTTDAGNGPFRRIGRYLLVEEVGSGGQATVWRAIQFEPEVREVALKLVPVGLVPDARRLARLQHEAERGGRMEGDSTLPVYEFGQDNGMAYLAMPLVSGGSLLDVIHQRKRRFSSTSPGPSARHPLSRMKWSLYGPAVVTGLIGVARSLEVAHQKRVVHRDVKPANILIPAEDPKRAFLADFGMGRDLDKATPEQVQTDGSGTPLYMTPERLRGETADPIGADLYALGVTLFEALTLRRPFPSVPVGMSGWLLMAWLSRQQPYAPRALEPRIPRGVESVILQAMHRDPSKRPPSARAIADGLAAALEEAVARPRRRWAWGSWRANTSA